VSQDAIARVTTLPTSGTTGAPKRLYFTEEDLELTVDFFHHGMSTLVEPRQRVLVLMPGERPGTVGQLLVRALARMEVACFVHGFVRDPARALDEVEERGIDSLVGLPVQVLGLARHSNARRLSAGRLKSVLLTADNVPGPVVRSVAEAFGCRVFEHYGMTEMGLGGGVHCRAFDGYHLREADLYFEVVDPGTGELVRDGQIGEVVFTTLTRTGMPLLRYRTGDLSRFVPGACPCGSALRRLDSVRARAVGAVVLEGGARLTMPELDARLFALEGLLDFTAAVERANGRDHIVVSARVGEAGPARAEVRAAVARVPAIGSALAAGVVTLGVDVVADPLPGPFAGKRRIDDRRGPESAGGVP
jgi:phenylacetate-coenzyme A ligase PaaK-like adenylate-forming protein